MEGFDANPEHACGHILIPAHHSQGLIWLLFQSAIVCYPEELATLIWMHSVVSHTCVCRRLGGVLPDHRADAAGGVGLRRQESEPRWFWHTTDHHSGTVL